MIAHVSTGLEFLLQDLDNYSNTLKLKHIAYLSFLQVADVVQNVQNVLKGELNKPPPVMTSVPTIPGHPNTEWSSILPAILGGESETAPVNNPSSPLLTTIDDTSKLPDTTLIKIPDPIPTKTTVTNLPSKESTVVADYDTKKKPTGILETETHSEKPMIQVPVITVDQKLPAHLQPEENTMPVFQMLNTISADKVKTTNNSQSGDEQQPVTTQQTTLPTLQEITAKPEKETVKPILIQESVVDQSTPIAEKLPEMVKINFDSGNLEKSTVKPELGIGGIITSESISKLPESEPESIVSVISETHSTSMKVSGQEEIPLREPAKPVIEPVNRIQLPSEDRMPEKSTISPSTDVEMDSTTTKAETIITTEKMTLQTTKKPGLFDQGVSFFGNLPDSVSSIVSDFISDNSESSLPPISGVDKETPVKTSESEIPQNTEPAPTTTQETVTSKKPVFDQKPVYEKIAEIIPDKKILPSSTSQSEASSIEHIIETLNDPTGSISGTVAADHFTVDKIPDSNVNVSKVEGIQVDSAKPTTAPEAETTTSDASVVAETIAEINSSKPIGPLSTELVDSLSSVISQISDVMPSVLPVSQSAGFDTNEKTSVVNVTADEPGTTEITEITNLTEVVKAPEEPVNTIELIMETETKTTADGPMELPVSEDISVIVPSTEKIEENPTTTIAPMTTEPLNLSSPTTVNVTTDLPVTEKIEVSNLPPENSKRESEKVETSTYVPTTDQSTLQTTVDSSVKTDNATLSVSAEIKPVEEVSTVKPATTVEISDSSVAASVQTESTEAPIKVQTENVSVIVDATVKPENQQKEKHIKNETIENNTELPIVRIDITEAEPTQFYNADKSQPTENDDNGTESPLVRIQLADPVTTANNMIGLANLDLISIPELVPLILPENGPLAPQTIGSGLIAGFPSLSIPVTEKSTSIPEGTPMTISPAKSQPEVQAINDANESITNTPTTTTVVPVENVTEAVTPETTELTNKPEVTEKTPYEEKTPTETPNKEETKEISTTKDILEATTKVPVEKINLPNKPVIVEIPEKATTLQVNLTQQTSTEIPKEEKLISANTQSSTVEIESSTIPATTEALLHDQTSTTKLMVTEKTTSKVDTTPAFEPTQDQIKISASPIPEPDTTDKVNETSKTNETLLSTSVQPETSTTAPQLLELPKPIKSELPVVRIDLTPESDLSEIPSKIQLTDLPLLGTTSFPRKPSTEDIQTFEPTEDPVNSTEFNKDILHVTTVKTVEKIVTEISNEKLESTTKTPENLENNTTSMVSEGPVKPSLPNATSQHTEEVRIQVNNTAVLVTKRPVPEVSSQKLEDVPKIPENQPITVSSTTPKISGITEDVYTKLGEKIERLPVPVKVSELSSIPDDSAAGLVIKPDVISASGTQTRIRLGEEQNNKEVFPTKVDDPRKPIKKNSDSDLLQSNEERVSIEYTTKKPIKDAVSVNEEKDSNVQPSIKVEMTTTTSVKKPSTIDGPTKVEEKPIKVTPKPKPVKHSHKPTINIKKDDALTKPAEDKWTLIRQPLHPTLSKPDAIHIKRPIAAEDVAAKIDENDRIPSSSQRPVVSLDHPQSASGLDSTVRNLETDITYFVNLCNELAFTFWTATNKGLNSARSLAVSPFGMTSMLAMVFLGARGPTSDQMNDLLKLDDVASFNPHLVFQNVTDAVGLTRNQGIANAAFVRELFADRSKVRKLLPFYKEQAQQFYDGVVAEVNFATISDLVRRRTNLMIRKQTGGRIKDFVRTNSVPLRSPLAALSANVFQTDCNSSAASSEGRDGELYFAVSPAVRQRKLVPVPATVWRAGVLAGYEPSLDATAIALGGIDKLVSTIFVIPGQQGHTAPGDTLDHLEQRLVKGAMHDGAWNKLLKVLIPRPGLELQVPKFSHRSVINATAALKKMGLEELFSRHADLKGINGVATDLHLADVLQVYK